MKEWPWERSGCVCAGAPSIGKRVKGSMQEIEAKAGGREMFEERVRLVSGKGPLLPCSLAVYVSGLSRARLRQLMSSGKVETEKVNGQRMIVLRSLVQYRRRILRRQRCPKRPTCN